MDDLTKLEIETLPKAEKELESFLRWQMVQDVQLAQDEE